MVTRMEQSATAKELPFTLNAIEEDLAARADELPSAVHKRIQKILAAARGGGFEAADRAKQQLDDLYKANSATTDQDLVNEAVLGYRKMLNASLEAAGGDAYTAAKSSAMRDMAMRDVEAAVRGAQGTSVKTALNKFFGSLEKQEEFFRKLPDGQRREWGAFLDSLEKVSGRFGGSDTASNTATGKRMGIETGLGFDANALNPQSWVDRLSAPIGRTVRKAQAEMTFSPDADRLAAAMRTGEFSYPASASVPRVLATEATKAATPPGTEPPPEPTPEARPVELQPVPPEANSRPDLLARIARAESGGNPNARAKTSTASGLYQFTDGTWMSMVSKFPEMGLTVKDKNDPDAQHAMARKLAAENARFLANKGIEPTDGNLYTAHVLGAPGAAKLIARLGTGTSAAGLLPKAARANRSVFYDKKTLRARTAEEVYQLLNAKVTEA